MADQGIEFEISVKDSTAPGAEAAKAALREVGDEAAKSTGKAAKGAKEAAEKFKSEFSPMTAVAAALTGNISALGQQLLGLVTRLKGVHMSMMQFAGYAAVVTLAAQAFSELTQWVGEASRQAERIRLDNAAAALDSAKAASAAFARNIDEARKNAEALTAALNGELDAMQRLAKAQNEFARAQELAFAKTDEERSAIERRYRSADAHNDREVSAARRAAEREALDGEIARLKEEVQAARDDQREYRRQARDAGRKEQSLYRRQTGWRTWWNGTDAADEEMARAAEWGRTRESAAAAEQDAIKRRLELERRLDEAVRRRGLLDVDEEAAQYGDAAEIQTEMNEAWAEADEAEKREIDEVKEAAVAAAEEVKEAQLAAQREVRDARMHDLQEATQAETDAQRRLAAARQAVDRAWGWYRNRDSLAAQLEEEKADAEAHRQYEKDFDRLKRQRPDWESAKNLSLDQEAVRRVALARREEDAAARAAVETAADARRAADSLEVIEAAFQEGGE
ncbi:MAG: hypothetical protein IKL96_06775 [Kiritimatiellae bacterium]|nr:hypothetical protein [Kiritimatiellia bacterium]